MRRLSIISPRSGLFPSPGVHACGFEYHPNILFSQTPRSRDGRVALAKPARLALFVFFAALCLAGPLPTLHAAITWTGNVDPADPTTWDSSTFAYVGKTANGSLMVDNGSDLLSNQVYVGYESSVDGMITVDGIGSTWTSSGSLIFGRSGSSGTLNIFNGGTVSNDNYCHIGQFSSSTSAVTVDGAGSTLTNGSGLQVGNSGTLHLTGGGTAMVGGTTEISSSGTINFGSGTLMTESLLFATPSQLTGTGTINTHGLVYDIDLVFDSTHGLNQTFALNSGNITVNLDVSDLSKAGDLCAGYKGNQSLIIRDGITVHSSSGDLGYDSGATGVATVDGAGSTWNIVHSLDVGRDGNGTLNIANGGVVNNISCEIGQRSGSTGVINVDGSGSTLTNDVCLFVGNRGNGTLNITNGGKVVNDFHGYVSTNLGSTGVATIDGAGSTWTNGGDLFVGNASDCSSTLSITGGGHVSNNQGYIGYGSGSTGAVTVDGGDSMWKNSGDLFVGGDGNGTLNIINGGTVMSYGVGTFESQSRLEIDDESFLCVYAVNMPTENTMGTIVNNGTVRVIAGAEQRSYDIYSPISIGTWSGSGIYKAVGGTWNAGTHQFTVSDVQEGDSGEAVGIDLKDTQRMLIDDSATGWTIGESFLASDSSKMLNITTTAINGTLLSDLEDLLEEEESILGAWNFVFTSGYSNDDPAYLSFDVGPGYSRDDLHVWHYDSTEAWTAFDAVDLSYDGQYANFTVASFSGYAVIESSIMMPEVPELPELPEPGTLIMLLAAGAAVFAHAWRKRVTGN